MIILIAESKSMNDCRSNIIDTASTPIFQAQATEIIDTLRRKSVATLAAELKLGPKNALRLYEEVYDFPSEAKAMPAIEAFSGVVFRALECSTLSSVALANLEADVRIVSSLYGLLRPSDTIKHYRLDFSMKTAPGGISLSNFWKPLLTEALKSEIKSSGQTEILNLLPLDASKCFDWKAIAQHAAVYTAEFKQYAEGGTLRTPNSDALKRLRGKLLRQILEQSVDSVADLSNIEHQEFCYDSQTANKLLFITA